VRLSDLSDGAVGGAAGEVEIDGLSVDSRRVRRGDLFAAISGTRLDGFDFIAEALAKGAAAVLAAPDPRLEAISVPVIQDAEPRRRLARMAARFFARQPATVAAVTGTNGKTSVVNFTAQIWSGLGHSAASLGTLGVIAGKATEPLAHTTPEPIALHRHLAELAAGGVECLALEASSHGLDQHRLDAVEVTAAAFTNIGWDHLDYHADADDYLAAKLRLFGAVMADGGTAVLNADSDVFDRLQTVCQRHRHEIVSYGTAGSEVRLRGLSDDRAGQRLALEVFGIRSEIVLPLRGAFQAMNALCALGLVIATGSEAEAAMGQLERLKGVPGRLDLVAYHGSGAPVYVDYSHKPDALENALRALRPAAAGRLVLVFGCGGDRDRGKRPEMGRIGARLADRVVVTDDNPRSEAPARIRAEILAGCPDAIEIGDRAEAIRAGLDGLEAEDLLIIAGKGHESGQYVGDEVLPFDDTAEARAAAQECGGRAA
jgi:UDP-N-acetylmuramoyl-L-alanyl-D-glutamate--2,6-diaminopimelate ligase